MKFVLAGLACVLIAGLMLWLWPTHNVARPEIGAAPPPPVVAKRFIPSQLPAAEAPAPAPAEQLAKALSANKIDTASDAFRVQKDEVIPGRLYTEAARCYKGGQNRDQKMKLEFRLLIADGQVSIPDVKVLESTITDPVLERCIRDEIKRARWTDDKMPDFESTEEMLIRLRGFKSHQQDEDGQ